MAHMRMTGTVYKEPTFDVRVRSWEHSDRIQWWYLSQVGATALWSSWLGSQVGSVIRGLVGARGLRFEEHKLGGTHQEQWY